MDLRDYLRLIRRGWPTLAALTLISLSITALYLVITPRQYSATATLLVTVNDPANVSEAQQGLAGAQSISATYAGVVESAAVVGPVASSLSPSLPLAQALEMVSASERDSTALIDVVVTGRDPAMVARLANGVAQRALTAIPTLQGRTMRNSPIALRPIQAAQQPILPINPDVQRVLSLGLILGLVLGLAATIAVQTLDTRLRRPEDVQKVGAVVLAALPRTPRAHRQGIVVANSPDSLVVEAYRTLRTNLGNLDAEQRHSLLIAPVNDDRVPAEVAVNTAWSLAQAGRSVLLVDLDLRRAPITDLLQLPAGPGVADMLEAGHPHDVIAFQPTTQTNLQVVAAGSPHASPSDVLSLPRLSELIKDWERRFDHVILHGPSLLAFTDAAVIARVTAATLITAVSGRTTAEDLLSAIGMLQSVRIDPLGVVLTGTSTSTMRDNRRLRSGRFARLPNTSDRRSRQQEASSTGPLRDELPAPLVEINDFPLSGARRRETV